MAEGASAAPYAGSCVRGSFGWATRFPAQHPAAFRATRLSSAMRCRLRPTERSCEVMARAPRHRASRGAQYACRPSATDPARKIFSRRKFSVILLSFFQAIVRACWRLHDGDTRSPRARSGVTQPLQFHPGDTPGNATGACTVENYTDTLKFHPGKNRRGRHAGRGALPCLYAPTSISPPGETPGRVGKGHAHGDKSAFAASIPPQRHTGATSCWPLSRSVSTGFFNSTPAGCRG